MTNKIRRLESSLADELEAGEISREAARCGRVLYWLRIPKMKLGNADQKRVAVVQAHI